MNPSVVALRAQLAVERMDRFTLTSWQPSGRGLLPRFVSRFRHNAVPCRTGKIVLLIDSIGAGRFRTPAGTHFTACAGVARAINATAAPNSARIRPRILIL